MVTIKDARTKKKAFKTLKAGDMFEYNGVLYMKVSLREAGNDNAVVVASGTMAEFAPLFDVWVAEVTVTINA